MKKLGKFVIGLFLIIACLSTFTHIIRRINNSAAYDVQDTLRDQVNSELQQSTSVLLAGKGGITWDYICPANYEYRGIDVVDSVYIIERKLKHIDFSNFEIANAHYNEFKGSRAGLIFVSIKRKISVAIIFEDETISSNTECVENQGAKLIPITGKRSPYSLTLDGTKIENTK